MQRTVYDIYTIILDMQCEKSVGVQTKTENCSWIQHENTHNYVAM